MFIILDTFRKTSDGNRNKSFENTNGLVANNPAVKGAGLTKKSSDFCPPGCYAIHVCERIPTFLKMQARGLSKH
jgi:hypothetical protein